MNNIEISKYLSYILRHKPETINLKLDKEGWGDIQYIIDNSQEYIDMANERINNYEQEKEIYENEISKHFVKETFAERKAKGLWNKKTEEKIVDK